jgi:peptidoglycan-associated lipoprotein
MLSLPPQAPSRSKGKLVRGAVAFFVLALALPLSCGGPRYPNCEKDEHCNDATHKGFCVRGLCTQCRHDSDCDDGKVCKDGACARPEGYCDSSHPCANGDCGEDHACKPKVAGPPVECDDDHPCSGTAHCENNHCVFPPQGGPGCTSFDPPKFDFESPNLTGSARQVIERLAGCLATGSLKNARVVLTGHCDARGENEFNMSLGAQRAEAVKAILVSLGVPATRITASSRGKLDATGSDEASMANDRRVDIEVR